MEYSIHFDCLFTEKSTQVICSRSKCILEVKKEVLYGCRYLLENSIQLFSHEFLVLMIGWAFAFSSKLLPSQSVHQLVYSLLISCSYFAKISKLLLKTYKHYNLVNSYVWAFAPLQEHQSHYGHQTSKAVVLQNSGTHKESCMR